MRLLPFATHVPYFNSDKWLTAENIQPADLPSSAERGTIVERLSDATLIGSRHRSSANGALLN